ncbi:MAG: hypothetical protein GQ524_00340 [Anaerolineales bacterium]|nr:hypothetical protein [Anaerolineales bacterium]
MEDVSDLVSVLHGSDLTVVDKTSGLSTKRLRMQEITREIIRHSMSVLMEQNEAGNSLCYPKYY